MFAYITISYLQNHCVACNTEGENVLPMVEPTSVELFKVATVAFHSDRFSSSMRTPLSVLLHLLLLLLPV